MAVGMAKERRDHNAATIVHRDSTDNQLVVRAHDIVD
jgi:hypothetical protein